MAKPWTWEEDGYTVLRSHARTGPGCHNNCGVLLYLKDGKLEKIEGDPDNPYNQGKLCPRCLAYKDILYHPDRLKSPMKRVGERGENKWEAISWDEAYDFIEEKWRKIMDEYGPKALAFFQGTGRDVNGYTCRLAFALGSGNYTCGFLSGMACYAPRQLALSIGIGNPTVVDSSQFFPDRYDNPEFKVPEYMIIWGTNPENSNPDGNLGYWTVEVMKRGTKVITIDPRVTWMAGKSEHFLQIRPGTDAALGLGLANIIIQEELYNKEFVEKWGYGFEDYAARCAEYPVERVAEICGLDPEDIKAVARAYATAESACIHTGLPFDQIQEGLHASIAIRNLVGLTGDIEKPGTQVIGKPAFGITQTWRSGWGFDLLSDEQKATRLGNPTFLGLTAMSEPTAITNALLTGEPHPIKGVFMQTNNPIACMGADTDRVYKALLNSEINVVVDLFMTPTAMAVADIILPASTFAERNGLVGHQPCFLGPLIQAVEPVGDTKSDQQILIDLGRRFNKEAYPWETDVEMYEWLTANQGIDYHELKDKNWVYTPFEYNRHEKGLLRPDGEPGFHTASGMFEFTTSVLDMFGVDPLPFYKEPPESPVSTPELYEKYPLVLTTGTRMPGLFHSEHRNVPSLRRVHPDPIAEIHKDVAQEHGIKNGDWIWIENHLGKCKQKAKVTAGIRPDVVSCSHGWWFPERDPEDDFYGVFESNINRLIGDNPGSTGFGNSYKASLCKVYKVEGGE